MKTGARNGGSSPHPAVGVGISLPGILAAAEHAPSHDDGTGRVDRLAEALGVRVRLSALLAVALAERFQRHGPFVQPLPAFAQRVLEGRIGPRDEAVHRRGDVDDRSHGELLVSSLGRSSEAKLIAA
jgi:hypothetical protein